MKRCIVAYNFHNCPEDEKSSSSHADWVYMIQMKAYLPTFLPIYIPICAENCNNRWIHIDWSTFSLSSIKFYWNLPANVYTQKRDHNMDTCMYLQINIKNNCFCVQMWFFFVVVKPCCQILSGDMSMGRVYRFNI